jgi:TM2 domain-containing membrane protein YozV
MSADIDRIASSMTMIHEIYAGFIETGIALYLLYRLLGVATVAPIICIIGMALLSHQHIGHIFHYRVVTILQFVCLLGYLSQRPLAMHKRRG